MISLCYLRENNAKLRENKRKLAIKTVRAADFRRLFISPAQESAPGNSRRVREGRDSHEYCTPYTDSVFVVRLSTGV